MQRYRLFLTRLVCAVFTLAITGGPATRITQLSASSSLFVAAQEYEWQTCSTFLSPNMGSWAVYAARSFRADELVEVTPFFVPLGKHETAYSVLDNYVFGFQRDNAAEIVTDDQVLNVVLLGNGGFYNHNPDPNLKYVQIIAREGDDIPHLVGFRATRDIAAGEQLYVSYVDNPADSIEWFEKRGIDAQTQTEQQIEPNMLPFYMSKHCSKIYGGVGSPTWKDNILPILQGIHQSGGDTGTILEPSSWMDLTRLAPFDAGLSDARAKVAIKKGGHVEKSLGLVLSRNYVRGTALGPIAFYWENMKIDHHQQLINLRDDKKLILQYQGPDTAWESVDRFAGYSEITVLPVSGNIGLVRRVGNSGELGEEYNCKLLIRSNKDHGTTLGVTLELIATRDIASGEVLKLNIAPSEFVEEYRLLHDEMEESGQPHHPGIFDVINDEEL
jgi:hypothetical protein